MQESKRGRAINLVPITTKPEVQINHCINAWLLAVTLKIEESPYKPDASLHSLDKDKTARIGELIYSDVSVWSIVI